MAKPPRPVKPSSPEDPIAEILASWRLWLLGALLGALLAWVLFAVFPPAYRARATVVVDNNLEEAWKFFPDRQLFQFLQRETERLEELAWSDAVLQTVTASSNDLSIDELRPSILQLSQPSDGGWHFYADHPDRAIAQTLASTWAQAFVDATRASAEASPELQMARLELDAVLFSDHDPSEEEVRLLTEHIMTLAEQTKGISPFVELYVSQSDDLPVERSFSQGTYMLLGSLVGALVVPLWVVLRPRPIRSRR
jgi:hypothetical protein